MEIQIKLILLCAGVILGLVAFVAFNSFGIDPETIYNAQDEMNVAIYDRARGYRYSGNEIYGIFNKGQEVENTEITEDGIVQPESDNGGGVYDPNSSTTQTTTNATVSTIVSMSESEIWSLISEGRFTSRLNNN